MAHNTHLMLDGFAFDLTQEMATTLDGGSVPVRKLIAGEPGVQIELIFSEADWDVFMQKVAASKITITSIVPSNHYAG